jgi:phosphoribosylanthranilate isomerase
MTAPLFVQVAGIRSVEEAQMLVEEGVTHLGYPLVLDHHREDLSRGEVRRVVEQIADAATHVVITYLTDPEDIVDLVRGVGATVCQLHAPIAAESLRCLKEENPDIEIIKSVVFHRESPESTIDRALECSPWVDQFITDTFDPATGASGATGKTHDWRLSATLVARSARPVILAGGLTPVNVAEAIRTVRPAGVDVHTGVENADGFKDRAQVRAFVHAARDALGAPPTVDPSVGTRAVEGI